MSSALPASVQKKVDEGNAIFESVYPNGIPPEQPPAEPVAEAPPAEAVAEAPPAEPTAEEVAPVASVTEIPPTDEAGWEHKYKVLQGKYNAEVPRLISQGKEQDQLLRDMRQQLTNTQTMVASLNQGTAVPEDNAGAPVTPPQRLVKDDEIHQFGADLHDFIKRTALETVQPGVQGLARLEQRISVTEQSVKDTAEVAAGNAVEKVLTQLDKKVPNWEVQNKDPRFIAWLDEVDPYAGSPRGELLSQAYAAHDGPRVVALFLGYQNENVALTPPTSEPPAPAVEVPAEPEAPGLEALVAPGTPKTRAQGDAPNEAGKRVWSQPDVTELYAKINEYTKKGKKVPKDLRAMEADLIRAQSTGRIQT